MAEILLKTEESDWLTQQTKENIERQFLRYGIEFGDKHTNILNNDNFRWPKWFEGRTVNLGSEFLDKQQSAAYKIAFNYYENGFEQTINYNQLLRKVTNFTEALAPRVDPETGRVLIILPTCLEAVISILACLRLGVLFSIMEPNYMQCMLLRMNDFKPTLIITINGCEFDPKFARRVAEAMNLMTTFPQPPNRFVVNRFKYKIQLLLRVGVTKDRDFYYRDSPLIPVVLRNYCLNKPLYVAYTAGTTGRPKGCVHSARSLYMSCISDNGFTVNPQTCDEAVSFFFTDLSNIVGLIGIVLKPMLFNVPSVLYETVIDNAEPKQIYNLLWYWSVTSAYFSKSTLEKLKSKDANGDMARVYSTLSLQLKTVFTSGAEMEETLNWMKTLFSKQFPLQVYNFYAITELGGIIFTDHSDIKGQPLSSKVNGRIVPFICVKFERLNRDLETTETGQLCIKLPLPPMMMISYWDNKELFLDNFYNDYYAIGDPGAIDASGNIVFYQRTVTFNEPELIRKMEQYMFTSTWVKNCCIICKRIVNKKQLYGFFQIKPECLKENPAVICKEIQGCVRYIFGSFTNFEVFDIDRIPLVAEGTKPDRELMTFLVHDVTQANIFNSDSNLRSFLAKVKEINKR